MPDTTTVLVCARPALEPDLCRTLFWRDALDRYAVHFDIMTTVAGEAAEHRGLALNMSAGGILIECPEAGLQPGDDVHLNLPIPGQRSPVEGRARVIRHPVAQHLGLRFEAFAG